MERGIHVALHTDQPVQIIDLTLLPSIQGKIGQQEVYMPRETEESRFLHVIKLLKGHFLTWLKTVANVISRNGPNNSNSSDSSYDPPEPMQHTQSAHGKLDAGMFSLTCSRSNNVALQREHRGQYCIPATLADKSCTTLGVSAIVENMNSICGKNHHLASPHLAPLLDLHIARGYDFGTVYGRLRRLWDESDWPASASQSLLEAETTDSEPPDGPPRRVWDLYSNRVLSSLPYIGPIRRYLIVCVSHSWRPLEDREDVLTPINGYEWPVPVPRGVSLDDVRIELLNLGAQYAWLDVLCLRQGGGKNEHLRAEEWKDDVPSIGLLYKYCKQIIVYFNGLGRPFEEADLDHPRHWCRRAWTLQEGRDLRKMTVAGITPQSPDINLTLHSQQYLPESSFSFQLLRRVRQSADTADTNFIFATISEMRRRSATKEIDKIAGLQHVLGVFPETAYRYIEAASTEDAWLRLIGTEDGFAKGILFFMFPAAGNGPFRFLPSWSQLQNPSTDLPQKPLIEPNAYVYRPIVIGSSDVSYECRVVLLSQCYVEGFDSLSETTDGSLPTMREGSVSEHGDVSFKAIARHSQCFPNGHYALVGSASQHSVCRFWCVGQLGPKRSGRPVFHKTSVLEIDDDATVDRLVKASGIYWKESRSKFKGVNVTRVVLA